MLGLRGVRSDSLSVVGSDVPISSGLMSLSCVLSPFIQGVGCQPVGAQDERRESVAQGQTVHRVAGRILRGIAKSINGRQELPKASAYESITGRGTCHSSALQGEVGVFFAGPPCQGFSRMNFFLDARKAHLNRLQYLVCLSWVDYLKPEYVYIENVL